MRMERRDVLPNLARLPVDRGGGEAAGIDVWSVLDFLNRRWKMILACGILAVALAISVGLTAIALVVYLKRHQAREFPAAPVVVTVTVTAPAPPPPPPSPSPSPPGTAPAPAVSIELPVTPNSPRKPSGAKPHAPHAPSSAPLSKPNNGIPDTTHRE